jgi:hypothetical protein
MTHSPLRLRLPSSSMQDIDDAAGSKMYSAESGKVVAAGPAPVFRYEIRGLH